MIARTHRAMRDKDSGFTLVELIVVVVIIGVLAAIAVPLYARHVATAKENADLAALANAKLAVASYMADVSPPDASPTGADLAQYGFPQSPQIAIDITVPVTGAYVLTLLKINSASDQLCRARALTAPRCGINP